MNASRRRYRAVHREEVNAYKRRYRARQKEKQRTADKVKALGPLQLTVTLDDYV